MLENWIWSRSNHVYTTDPQSHDTCTDIYTRVDGVAYQLSWHPLESVIRSKSFRPFVSKIWMKHKSLLGSVRFSLLLLLTHHRPHPRHTRPANMKYFIYIFTFLPRPSQVEIFLVFSHYIPLPTWWWLRVVGYYIGPAHSTILLAI